MGVCGPILSNIAPLACMLGAAEHTHRRAQALESLLLGAARTERGHRHASDASKQTEDEAAHDATGDSEEEAANRTRK